MQEDLPLSRRRAFPIALRGRPMPTARLAPKGALRKRLSVLLRFRPLGVRFAHTPEPARGKPSRSTGLTSRSAGLTVRRGRS
jgi:hypothetical protein